MHIRRNCHLNVWILSGTCDGPSIVKGFIAKGYEVSVSVVSFQASLAYSDMPLKNMWIGPLDGARGIRRVLENAYATYGGFNCVVDATHPFAQEISFNLKEVCQKYGQPLIRFERCCKTISKAVLIENLDDLLSFNLKDQKVLFAIGSRLLPKALELARRSEAISFARVLPTTEALLAGLSSDLPETNLAVVRPSQGNHSEIESALCRKWGITGIVARESGGPTQALWQEISLSQNLDLWLIARPIASNYDHIVNSNSELFEYF